MRLEHIFDLDLRYEGDYVVVRPYGGLDGVGYAAGSGSRDRAAVEGAVRFSNNPRVRGDGVLLADLAGAIATDDGARIVFSLTGLGRKDAERTQLQRRARDDSRVRRRTLRVGERGTVRRRGDASSGVT